METFSQTCIESGHHWKHSCNLSSALTDSRSATYYIYSRIIPNFYFILFYSILAKEEEQEPNVEINNDEIDMGEEDEDIDVESDDDDLDTKAEHGMFIE